MATVTEGRFQCPCCDYFVLSQRARHDTCPICCWEDDGSDLGEIDAISSANHISLRQARTNFASYGAADHAAVSLVAPASARVGLRRESRARGG
jgi:hypothetical protein